MLYQFSFFFIIFLQFARTATMTLIQTAVIITGYSLSKWILLARKRLKISSDFSHKFGHPVIRRIYSLIEISNSSCYFFLYFEPFRKIQFLSVLEKMTLIFSYLSLSSVTLKFVYISFFFINNHFWSVYESLVVFE